jgi:hypothetical protein
MTKAEKDRIYSREYRKNNPEKVRAASRKYNLKKRIDAETDIDKFVDLSYRRLLDRTALRNKKGRDHEMVDFDREFLKKKIIRSNGVCSISGLPLSFKKGDLCVVSVDRKNNSKGYVKSNIQIVAACVNKARQDLTMKQFVALCKEVAKNNP